jgi:hypothetical protein
LLNSENQASPYTCWYILDPLLNIFYIIDSANLFNELFASVSDVGNENSKSSPSINFSSDNNSIYVANGTSIRTFRLDENKLTLVNTQSYSVKGFVGRDGQIVEGVGLYGRQDPSNYGVDNADVGLTLTDGIYNLSYIAPSRLGDFKCLYACEVVSENGYYSYNYKYLTGTFSHVDTTFLIEWDDLDNPNENYHHEKSVGTTSDPVINKYKYHYNAFMGKIAGDTSLYLQMELLDHLFRPSGYQYPLSSQSANYYIFGETIPFYTDDPIVIPYDPRKPFTWSHIEIGEELIFRGVLLNRTADAGDNLKRMYKNGASCLGTIATAVGTTETNLLGLAYIPSADRLNK